MARLIFLLLQHIFSEIIEQCMLPESENFIITKFFRDKCGPCDRITHFIEEIDSRLERNNHGLQIRYVNCSECDCKSSDITKVPAITVHKDGVEIGRLIGYRDFGEIVEFLSAKTDIDRTIFKKRIKSSPGKVVKLKEKDFLTGFEGPWLILFFNTKSDLKRELIEQMAEEYESKLNVGEINGNLVPALVKRFSISYFPTLIAVYNGLVVGYNGKDDPLSMKEFVDELLRPSFSELSFEEFTSIEKQLGKGTPIFIAFYKDLTTVNEYFKSIAHEYKFRARIYKSNDSSLMERAGIKLDQDGIVLTVYRNKAFLAAAPTIEDRDQIFQWIFHTHYPFVTRINNDNFYAIFHGFKPVVLLLTKNEDLVNEFEEISELVHNGLPFTDKLFSAIDVSRYSLFIPSLLPNIKVPSIVMLDPIKSIFYSKIMKITSENIKEITMDMIEKYDSGKLPIYPGQKNWITYFIIIAFSISLLFYIIKKISKRKLKVIQH